MTAEKRRNTATTKKVGFDCSALTRYLVHETTGIDVGRVSQDQYRTTTEIPDKNNPSVGNLGFPRGQSKWGNGGSGHVVMYMGGGVIVDAPESGKYVKNTIASDKGDCKWFARGGRYVALVAYKGANRLLLFPLVLHVVFRIAFSCTDSIVSQKYPPVHTVEPRPPQKNCARWS